MSLLRRFRSASLFWTLTGSFFLVLLLAIILQGLVVLFVVEPLARRWTEERGRRAAVEAAGSIVSVLQTESLGREATEVAIREALRDASSDAGDLRLFFLKADDGGSLPVDLPAVVADHEVPRRMTRFLRGMLTGPDAGGDSLRSRAPAPGRQGPPGPPSPPGRLSPRDGDPRFRGGRGMRILERSPVSLAGTPVGYVVAAQTNAGFLGWPLATPRPVLLFLPLALVLAGGAGLVLFRVLVGRLRELERLASRVADGDLDARVSHPGSDEIGRLGSQLNVMTERLSMARTSLEDADRQRRQLLGDISHELATPLTAIRGFAETLLSSDVSLSKEEEREYLRDLLEAANRLDLLIKDVLDLTRLEGGAVHLETERLDWRELCRNTVHRYQGRFAAAGLQLVWDSSDDGKAAWVEADGRRLEQVLENLLVNAMRYVPSGGQVEVEVVAAPGSGDATSTMFQLTVADTGSGFPAKALPHVFERFYRGDTSRADGGTGLGLAIVKEIISRHGGNVTAANRESGGAVLSVRLPPAQS